MQGAVENVLERSAYVQLADGSTAIIDEQCRKLLLLRHSEMSSKGLRCLGLAYKDDLGELSDYYAESHPAHKKLLDPSSYSSIESNLVFVGVVGLRVSFPSYYYSIKLGNFRQAAFLWKVKNSNRTLLARKFIEQLRAAEELGSE